MSKIIFFDIDGTLYDSRIGIPESTVNALNRLIANEHKIVMCTGRSKGMIPEEYFHMGFDGVILGAGTYVEYEGKILHQELMTPEEVQTVIDWGKKQKIGIILEGEKYGYYDPENTDDYYIAMKNKTEADCKTILYPLNEAVDVPKWTYHHMELSKKPEIEEILGHKYKGTYHEPVNSVEFVPLGVNKAKGIEVILDHTGISREDSYAFGDSANDIDMIKYVKYGVAMGNSVPELLEIAPYQTARVDEDDKINGLLSGGDDYITKPFSLRELEARIVTNIKREERHQQKTEYRFMDEMLIDYSEKIVAIAGHRMEFTKIEYQIIEFLSMHPGQVFDKERIYAQVCGYDAEGDSRTITELVRRIRKKIADYSEKEYIETVWGIGYRWKK